MYVQDEQVTFPYGLGRWKDVFKQLKDVRRCLQRIDSGEQVQ